MGMSKPSYETLKQTVIAHVRAYEGPPAWDFETIWKHQTEECVQYLHPKESLPDAFNGPIRKTRYAKALGLFGPVLDRCVFEIQDISVDVEKRLVGVRLQATLDFKGFGDEEAEQGYTAEYTWFVELDETVEKTVRVEEFMDVQRLMGHVEPKAERYLAFLAAKND